MVLRPSTLLFTTLIFTSVSHAANAPIGRGLAPLTGVIGAMPGEFSFKQYDQGELEKFAVQIAKDRSDADRQYFLDAVAKINSQFQDHVRATILSPNGLKQLSNSAYKNPSVWVDSADFLTAIDAYNVSKTSLLGTIASLKAYGDKTLEPSEVVLPDGTVTQIRGYGKIDLSSIVENYTSEVARIESVLKNLKWNLKMTDGTELALPANSNKGLDPSIAITAISVDPAKLADWRKQSQRLRRWDPSRDRPVIDEYTRFARRKVGNLLYLYGSTERRRFHSAKYKTEKETLENEIAKIFWSRSYLRARYGLPLGAIQTSYEKSFANLDVFFVYTENLAKFKEEIAWTSEDFDVARQNLRLATDVAKDRSILAETGEGWGIINSTIQQANYFFTWAGGKYELADSARVVLEMLAADLYEEILVSQSGSLAVIQQNYKTRYYSDEKSKAEIINLAKTYDPKSWASEEGQDDDPLADLGKIKVGSGEDFVATGGLGEVFANVLVKCQQKEEVDLPLAVQIERNIRIASMGVKNSRGQEATKGLR